MNLSKWAYGSTFSQRNVRLAFADFVTTLLRNYRRYIRPVDNNDSMQMAFDYELFCQQKKSFEQHQFFYEVSSGFTPFCAQGILCVAF